MAARHQTLTRAVAPQVGAGFSPFVGAGFSSPVGAGFSRPILAFLVALVVCGGVMRGVAAPPQSRPVRIVSAVPSATEMLFAIGAGREVVAVSSFDSYPPEVATLPRVGGLLDPDIERIFALKPDLVIVYATMSDLGIQLARAGIPTFEYTHGGLADVTATLRALGARVGRAGEAERAARAIEERLENLRRTVAGRPRPRTLVVMGRDPFTLRNIYASGGVGFLHDMLEAAGGADVFADVRRENVQATSELVLARAPDVILELRGEFGSVPPSEVDRDRQAWQALPSVPAVRTGRVYVLTGASFVVPGPRVADAVERIARTLHPEAFRER